MAAGNRFDFKHLQTASQNYKEKKKKALLIHISYVFWDIDILWEITLRFIFTH